jgi:alpha-ketoglutarate-dependent taurine dioxygenase
LPTASLLPTADLSAQGLMGVLPIYRAMTSIGSVTSQAALYLGRRRNAYVMGLELAESERLLDEIWSFVDTAVYAHRWALGDLVLWDNRTTMHRRDAFDPKARRVMHRTQIKGSATPRRAPRPLLAA